MGVSACGDRSRRALIGGRRGAINLGTCGAEQDQEWKEKRERDRGRRMEQSREEWRGARRIRRSPAGQSRGWGGGREEWRRRSGAEGGGVGEREGSEGAAFMGGLIPLINFLIDGR